MRYLINLSSLLQNGQKEEMHKSPYRSLPMLSKKQLAYSEMLINSLGVQVFPNVVMATPVMLIKTATIFVRFIESWPRRAPKKSVNSPDVEVRTVVLATLVFASAEFDKYCMRSKHIKPSLEYFRK